MTVRLFALLLLCCLVMGTSCVGARVDHYQVYELAPGALPDSVPPDSLRFGADEYFRVRPPRSRWSAQPLPPLCPGMRRYAARRDRRLHVSTAFVGSGQTAVFVRPFEIELGLGPADATTRRLVVHYEFRFPYVGWRVSSADSAAIAANVRAAAAVLAAHSDSLATALNGGVRPLRLPGFAPTAAAPAFTEAECALLGLAH